MKKIYDAAITGSINLVYFFIEKGAHDWEYGLKGACYIKNLELIEFMISKRANVNWGLEGACEGGHLEIICSFTNHNLCKF